MTKKVKTDGKPTGWLQERDLFSVCRSGIKPIKKSASKEETLKKSAKVHLKTNSNGVSEQKQYNRKTRKDTYPNIRDVTKISYQSLSAGMVVAGCVSHVTTERLVVALPHSLMGVVPLTHVSAPYTRLMHQFAEGAVEGDGAGAHTLQELFRVGQFLAVAVAAKPLMGQGTGITGLALSLYPDDVAGSAVSVASVNSGVVLQCAVAAVEDHGFILDTGVRGVTAAFLPARNVPNDTLVAVGSVLACVVLQVRGGGRVQGKVLGAGDEGGLHLTMSAVAADVATAASKLPTSGFAMLRQPGAAVEGVVKLVENNRIVVSLQPDDDSPSTTTTVSHGGEEPERGVISSCHLRGPFDQIHLFRTGQKLQCKFLFATVFPHTLHLSINKNIFNYNPSDDYDPRYGVSIHDIFPEATVLTATLVGVRLRLTDKCLGFCRVKDIADEPLKRRKRNANAEQKRKDGLLKALKTGSKVICKVVAFNEIDQVFIVTMRPSQMIGKNERPDTIELLVGMVVLVTIKEYVEHGALVETSDGVKGFVHRIHMKNVNIAKCQLKHPVGTTCMARVILCKEALGKNDKTIMRIQFTLRAMLVKSELPLVTEYNEGNIGVDTLGVVRHITTAGIHVNLCGEVQGLLFMKNLPQGTNLNVDYKIGKVIKVKTSHIMNDSKPRYNLLLSSIKKESVEKINVNMEVDGETMLEENSKTVGWLAVLKNKFSESSESEKKSEN